MDIQKLRTTIFDKTGIRVDAADPIFTLVALNEAMLEESIALFNQVQSKNNAELDERVGKLVVLHRNIVSATELLIERADHAHKAAALKAAADARAQILETAQAAMNTQLVHAASLIKGATDDLAIATTAAKNLLSKHWIFSTIQTVIGGVIAGGTVSLLINHTF